VLRTDGGGKVAQKKETSILLDGSGESAASSQQESCEQGTSMRRSSRNAQLPSYIKDYELFYEAIVASEGTLFTMH